jgi:antitoxin component of MazEF toxin-antitoxin module
MNFNEVQYRQIQAVANASFSVVLPNQYAEGLGLNKGDYVKVQQDGGRIVVERAEG